MKKKLLIQKYKESWVSDFKQIKKVINEVFLNMEVSIEHIGSTAIRGLSAKPIIDIDIVFDPTIDFEIIKSNLEKLGYYHNGDQGIKDRAVFKRRESNKKHKVLDFINHHLYACPLHSEELKRHIIFRNYLNEHEVERKKYENIKYKIAEEANQDKKVYAELKEVKAKKLIESILKKAKEKHG